MSTFNIDDMKFWAQVLKDSERTIFCAPEYESRVKCMVDAYGLGGVTTVIADPAVPDDKIFVADMNAIEAGNSEALQRDLHEWMRIKPMPPLMWSFDLRERYGIDKSKAWHDFIRITGT